LLVFGGSRGARSLNLALLEILDDLLDEIQIIHVSGELDWETAQARRAQLSHSKRDHYHAFPYLHEEMALAFAASDLVVCRAGASTLGEFPMMGLAAILVPYPYAWRYQKVNADYLAGRGAAIRLNDEDLKTKLLTMIRDVMRDTKRLSAMRQAARALAVPDAADRIAAELLKLASQSL
jgi:UDP-N-acetylglucosamine--N-acetylmuramyl-(pentapeptide) pyrophosphoryl-undecaprenol N-acetylglucosamine transferase